MAGSKSSRSGVSVKPLAAFMAEAHRLVRAIETSRGERERIRQYLGGLQRICIAFESEVGTTGVCP